jgi:Tfp pilus assembly protein PilV
MTEQNNHFRPFPEKPLAAGAMARARNGSRMGIVLVQVLVSMVIIVICGGAGIRALIEMNRKAAAMRTLNQARAFVQSKLDYAMGMSFTKDSVPTEFAYGTSPETSVNLVVSRTDKTVVPGFLTRIVSSMTAYPGDLSAPDIRKLTYKIRYDYRQKSYYYEMSSIRATD